MENETDVIKQQMLETRTSMTEKIEALENKVASQVTATTTAVAETVDSVKETVGNVVNAVESTVGAVKDSVESAAGAVSDTVESTVESVKQAFDVPAWLENPWVLLGGSVLLGYVGGRLLSSPGPSYSGGGSWFTTPRRGPTPTAFGATAPEPRAVTEAAARVTGGGQPANGQQHGWTEGLTQALGPAMTSLKELAIGTLGGVASELVTSSLPQELGQEVKNVVEQFTTSLGGKPIHVPLTGEEKTEEQTCGTAC